MNSIPAASSELSPRAVAREKQLASAVELMRESGSALCPSPTACPSSWVDVSAKQVAFWAYWSATGLLLKIIVACSHFTNCVPLTVRESDVRIKPLAEASVPPELLISPHGSLKATEIRPSDSKLP